MKTFASAYAPYICLSNLVNCKFTLVPACSKLARSYRVPLVSSCTAPDSKGGESETELVVSSTAQGPAKNAIKIDVLLTDSDNRGRLNLRYH